MGARSRRAALPLLLGGSLACSLIWFAARASGAEETLEARAESALRAGARASARGAPAEAAEQFDAAAAMPELAPHARALAARAWLDGQRADAAEASARAGLDAAPEAPIAADLFASLADARAARDDAVAARAAWREALAREPEPERGAALRLRLAESLVRAGELDAASAELRTVWVDAAERSEGQRAGVELDTLERREERPLRSAGDWKRRGDHLFGAQRSEAALGAYERALALGLAGSDRSQASRRRADCLFRLRRYDAAVVAFAALGDDPEARVWQARSLARAGRVDEATAALEAIGAESHGATSAWARYLAGLLHEGRGREERARVLFASAVDAADERVAADALWRLGWSAYRSRELDTARRRFRALASRPRDPLDSLAARYWAARALEASEPAEAQRELGEIAAEYPFSYYGWRASGRAPSNASVRAAIRDGSAALTERDLVAARLLVAADLRDAAVRAAGPLAARAANVDDRIAVARLYRDARDFHRAQALLVRTYAGALARGPAAGQEDLWRLAWPDAFAAERRRALPEGATIDAWFVLSIVREESSYRPDVESVAGAVGLLQLMPDTAMRLAPELGLVGFTPAQLVEPALNLRLGASYLDRLARRFDGSLEATAASYNAGADAVSGWRRGALPAADEWVESIPYDETRAYVKRVLRSDHVHRALYPEKR